MTTTTTQKIQVGDEVRVIKAGDKHTGEIGIVNAIWQGQIQTGLWIKVSFGVTKRLYRSSELDVKSYDHMIDLGEEMAFALDRW